MIRSQFQGLFLYEHKTIDTCPLPAWPNQHTLIPSGYMIHQIPEFRLHALGPWFKSKYIWNEPCHERPGEFFVETRPALSVVEVGSKDNSRCETSEFHGRLLYTGVLRTQGMVLHWCDALPDYNTRTEGDTRTSTG